jgi:Flp pilus assembly protein TadG
MTRPSRDAETGQAVVETALSLMVLVLLMFGVLDMGRAFWSWQALSAAAHEGARWASVRGESTGATMEQTESGVRSYLATRHGTTLQASTTVEVTWPNGSHAEGNPVRVELRNAFQPTTPLVNRYPIPLRVRSEMPILR